MGHKGFILILLLMAAPMVNAEEGTSTGGHDSFDVERGGFFVEPLLASIGGASSVQATQLPLATEDSSATSGGYGLGVRLGVHAFESILFGIDARYGKSNFSDSFYGISDGPSYNLGPTLILQTPFFGVRVLGTFIAAGDFNPGPGVSGLDFRFKNLVGFRLGGGLFFGPVSLNMEYQKVTHATTQIESPGALNIGSAASVDFSDQSYILSLSFPIEL